MRAVQASDLPRNLGQNIRYYRNRAGREGALEFTVANEAEYPGYFDELVRLHSERWRTRGKDGVFSDARMLAWHREAIPRLVNDGLVRLFALRLRGQVIAAAYCLVDPPSRAERSLYVYLPAFSPRHSALSPGTLLLASIVEQARSAGVKWVDLLRGEESYKRLWHPGAMPTFGFEFEPARRRQVTPTAEAA